MEREIIVEQYIILTPEDQYIDTIDVDINDNFIDALLRNKCIKNYKGVHKETIIAMCLGGYQAIQNDKLLVKLVQKR